MSKPSIRGRKKARRILLQSLYGWSLSQNSSSIIEDHVFKEHADEQFDKDYFQELLRGIIKNHEALESLFSPHLSRKIHELDLIELNVLRLATYELQQKPEIPYRVIINEALELAKTYGAKDSFKFVNGVLDKLAAELRPNEIGNL